MKVGLCAIAAVAVSMAASQARAASLNAGDWVESAFDSTGSDAVTNIFGAPSQSGSSVIFAMPTNASNWAYSYGGGTGFNAAEHLAATGASLTGNLSGTTGLSASFRLNNSTLASGAAFTTADFGGESLSGGGQSETIRFYIKSGTYVDPGASAYGISEWWYNPTAASVTSMTNGGSVLLSADFSNLSGWTDINGLAADSSPTETAAFKTTLTQITSLGLSLGSGTYYSDGFGFSTGGTGDIQLDSFQEVSAVPLPAAFGPGLAVMAGIGIVYKFRSRRLQKV